MNRSYLYIGLILFICQACSNQINTPANRVYHSINTRYNIYYNAKTTFDELYNLMVANSFDSLTQTTFIDPISLQRNKTFTFDPVIEKCKKAIREHSIKQKPPRKRGWRNDPKQRAYQAQHEYNPLLVNCWLLMGKAQFYNADFNEAATTFSFIRQFFKENVMKTQEATLWLAKCYLELGWNYQADWLLSQSKTKQKNGVYDFMMADLLLRKKEYIAAIPYLQKVSKNRAFTRKIRINSKRIIKEISSYESKNISHEANAISNFDPMFNYLFYEINSAHDSIYQQTYSYFLSEDYQTTLAYSNRYLISYPESSLRHRFLLLQGISYLYINDIDNSKNTLEELIDQYPDAETIPTAQNILGYLAAGKTPYSNSFSGINYDLYEQIPRQLSTDTIPDKNIQVSYHIVVTFSHDIQEKDVIFWLATFNFTQLTRNQLDIEKYANENNSPLIIYGFTNLSEAERYVETVIQESQQTFGDKLKFTIIKKQYVK